MHKILSGAVDKARQQKKEIPMIGVDGIPIHDEIMFKKKLYR